MNLKTIGALALAAMMMAPALAQDDAAEPKKKGRQARARQNAANQMIAQLKEVKLTDEQVAKIKELGTKATAEMKAIRDAAGITPELQKKRAAVQKSMKDSDKPRKELMAAINKEAGFTDAHAAALKKANAVRMKLQKDVVALLTEEQKANLPARMKRGANAGAAKKGAKKRQANKKKDDA